jgi:hypothetical protein
MDSTYFWRSSRGSGHALKLHLIDTDGQFFVSELKGYAQSRRCICPDEMYGSVAAKLHEVVDAHIWMHDKFRATKYPQILPCSWYQDGLQHSLQRVLRLRKTGRYSDLHRLINTATSYEKAAKEYRKRKNYSDAAYCYGYSYGYKYAAFAGSSNPDTSPPLFFYFDFLSWSKSAFRRNISKLPQLHQAAYKYSKHAISKYPKDFDLVLDHKDQL